MFFLLQEFFSRKKFQNYDVFFITRVVFEKKNPKLRGFNLIASLKAT